MSDAALAPVAETQPQPTRQAVLGYVEARTQDRLVGWAWDPAAPAARLSVLLMAGERVLARRIADEHRDDLLRNGVGDGGHAFTFLLDDAAGRQAAILDVAVEHADGARVRLSSAGGEAAPAMLAQVQRGLAALAAGQRTLLKAVQVSPADHGAELAEAIAAITSQQERIAQAVGSLEIFVSRLDERLAAMAQKPPQAAPLRGLVALGSLLALCGGAVLAWAVMPMLG